MERGLKRPRVSVGEVATTLDQVIMDESAPHLVSPIGEVTNTLDQMVIDDSIEISHGDGSTLAPQSHVSVGELANTLNQLPTYDSMKISDRDGGYPTASPPRVPVGEVTNTADPLCMEVSNKGPDGESIKMSNANDEAFSDPKSLGPGWCRICFQKLKSDSARVHEKCKRLEKQKLAGTDLPVAVDLGPGWCRICGKKLRSSTATVHAKCAKDESGSDSDQDQPNNENEGGEPAKCRICGQIMKTRGAKVHQKCRANEIAEIKAAVAGQTMCLAPARKKKFQGPYSFFFRKGGAQPGTPRYLRHDFLNNTRYEGLVKVLLLKRSHWEEIVVEDASNEPLSELDFAWVGIDLMNVDLEEVLSHTGQRERRRFARETIEERVAPWNGHLRGVYANCRIHCRSYIRNRLPAITVLAMDKALLCDLVALAEKKQGRDDSCLPPYVHFSNAEVLMDSQIFESKIQSLLDHHEGNLWVLRPTRSSRGGDADEVSRGIHVIERDRLVETIKELAAQRKQEVEDKKAAGDDDPIQPRWILSRFVKSFLWKLKENPAWSLRLVDKYHLHPVLKPASNATEMRPTYPPIGLPQSYEDKSGRSCKARFWFALDLCWTDSTNDAPGFAQLRSFLYDTVHFEIAGNEFPIFMSDIDINHVIPERNQNHFDVKSDIDEVTKCRATDLDFTRAIGGCNGAGVFDAVHPLGVGAWEGVVVQNLKRIMYDVVTGLEDYMVLPTKDQQFAAFQYFGADIIIDGAGKVWLCEVNTRPWCGYDRWWESFDPSYECCPSIWRFMESLLCTFVDPHFPSARQESAQGSGEASTSSEGEGAAIPKINPEWNVESAWQLVDERKLT